MMISESTELTREDVELVHRWGGTQFAGAREREIVLVGRLQRALVAQGKAIAEEVGLRVDGRLGPRTRTAYETYNACNPNAPIELGPELGPLLEPALIPEAPITLDAPLEDEAS
jgi:hypothetical protein